MKARTGFTLLEIMIVVAVIAILAAIAIPNYNSYRKTSQMKACLSNLAMLDNATSSYLLRNGVSEDTEITMDMLAPTTEGASKEKYFIVHLPECPTGGEYRYNQSKRCWYCSLGGDETANGGFPHGQGGN